MTWIDDKQEAGRQLWASSPVQLLPDLHLLSLGDLQPLYQVVILPKLRN